MGKPLKFLRRNLGAAVGGTTGAIVGGLLAGPEGAAAVGASGAAVGHKVDTRSSDPQRQRAQAATSIANAQKKVGTNIATPPIFPPSSPSFASNQSDKTSRVQIKAPQLISPEDMSGPKKPEYDY